MTAEERAIRERMEHECREATLTYAQVRAGAGLEVCRIRLIDESGEVVGYFSRACRGSAEENERSIRILLHTIDNLRGARFA